MKLKTFKNKLEKISAKIETELNNLRDYADDVDDVGLIDKINDLTADVAALIVEDSEEPLNGVTLHDVNEYIAELEEMENEYAETEEDY